MHSVGSYSPCFRWLLFNRFRPIVQQRHSMFKSGIKHLCCVHRPWSTRVKLAMTRLKRHQWRKRPVIPRAYFTCGLLTCALGKDSSDLILLNTLAGPWSLVARQITPPYPSRRVLHSTGVCACCLMAQVCILSSSDRLLFSSLSASAPGKSFLAFPVELLALWTSTPNL